MYVAVMGYGTVGSGVVEVFNKNHDSIVRRSTRDSLDLKYILDLRDFPDDPNEDKFIKDFNIILNDADVNTSFSYFSKMIIWYTIPLYLI